MDKDYDTPLFRAYERAEENIADEAWDVTRDSTHLLDLAMIRAFAGGPQNQGLASYFLVMAAQLGIQDSQKMGLVRALISLGHLDEATEILAAIYSDPSSMHYQSDVAATFMAFIVAEHDRDARNSAVFVAAGTLLDPAAQRLAVEEALGTRD